MKKRIVLALITFLFAVVLIVPGMLITVISIMYMIWLPLIFLVIILASGWITKKDEAPEIEPAPDDTTTRMIERTVEKVVLVICPYCGAKTEQGITVCSNCKAEI